MKAARPTAAVAVRVGTCGYSYKDWVGPVYPNATKAGEMLDLYARQFVTVEIDATYYRVPGAATFESMTRRTPDGFRFTAKLPGAGTHLPDAGVRGVHDDVRLFCKNISPLVDAGKFACVLAQFPASFRPSDATRSYLGMLREALGELRLVVEFRHREWQTDETLELLRSIDVGLVNVDEPHFKTLPRESSDVTSSIAYVRFHGRNAANWWRGTNVTRYDYSYSSEELEPWVHRLTDIAADPNVREVYAYFNNHARGQAVRNAERFEDMLREALPKDSLLAAPRDSAEASRSLELPLGGPIT